MGAEHSTDAVPPLATACVSAVTLLTVEQFRSFRECIRASQCLTKSDRVVDPLDDAKAHGEGHDSADDPTRRPWSVPPDLTVDDFTHALDHIDVASSDRTVFDHLFVLMDRTGDDVVSGIELFIAMAMLIHQDMGLRFQVAVECLQEQLDVAPIQSEHVLFLLTTMTTVANYFGDPLLAEPVLAVIANDAIQELELSTADAQQVESRGVLARALTDHPLVHDYVDPTRAN